MKKSLILATLFSVLFTLQLYAQVKGFADDFDDNILSCKWHDDINYPGTYSLNETNGKLEITVNQTTTNPTFFWIDFGQTVDLNPYLYYGNINFLLTTGTPVNISVGIGNQNGFSDPLDVFKILQSSGQQTQFEFADANYRINYGGGVTEGIDKTYTTKFFICINPNGTIPFKGKIILDNLVLGYLGTTSILNGGIANCGIVTDIHEESYSSQNELVGIYNTIGQNVSEKEAVSGLYIYCYSDGKKVKVIR